jgi:hypothetical protein
MVVAVPYRTLLLRSADGAAETHRVRVSDAAVEEWLRERANLRDRGYPDRPPDLDTPTLRAWLPRPGEQGLPYFRDRSSQPVAPIDTVLFPVYTAVWHAPGGLTAKVLVTGTGDGGFVSRVVIVNAAGGCPVDKAHRLDPNTDPNTVWDEIETIVHAINEAPMGWGPDDPLVTNYVDFIALDAEVEVAEAEARAAGLLAPEWVH